MGLPDDAQALAEIAGRAHGRIGRKRTSDFREWVIEREVMGDDFCAYPAEEDSVAALLYVDALPTDRAGKTIAAGFPMEDLPRVECPGEIELRGRDFSQ